MIIDVVMQQGQFYVLIQICIDSINLRTASIKLQLDMNFRESEREITLTSQIGAEANSSKLKIKFSLASISANDWN